MDQATLDKLRKAKIEKGVKAEQNPVIRWNNSDKKSRALAITANCAECMGCSATHWEPGFKEEIRNCTITNCTFHGFRPYQVKSEAVA